MLPNVGDYVRGLSRAAFTRSEIARPETAEYKHWATEIKLDALVRQPIFEITRRAVLGFRHAIDSDIGLIARTPTSPASATCCSRHTDCLPDQHDLTALWYLCEQWDLEWGGETMFFDAQDEVACAVQPRPGRLVIFDGAIKHVGRPPNRICYAPRYTFAIKFERIAAP